jgi:hypothetical protein
MNLTVRALNDRMVAELFSDHAEINQVDDALDLLGHASYLGATVIVIREKNLCPEFFDLSTRIAGEILQKFSNYHMKLAIIGDFSKYPGKSLKDFIRESNKGGHVVFVSSMEEAQSKLKK